MGKAAGKRKAREIPNKPEPPAAQALCLKRWGLAKLRSLKEPSNARTERLDHWSIRCFL